MRKFYYLVLFVSVFLMDIAAYAQMQVDVGVPGLANRKCYTAQEAEAEQGIKIHSELMVIALNCQHMTPRGWKNFYNQYQEITRNNANLIGGYENILINYFALAGRSNPERAFNDMRTDLANKVSVDAARMRPDVFCSNFAARVPKVARMGSSEIQRWAASASKSGASRPFCK